MDGQSPSASVARSWRIRLWVLVILAAPVVLVAAQAAGPVLDAHREAAARREARLIIEAVAAFRAERGALPCAGRPRPALPAG